MTSGCHFLGFCLVIYVKIGGGGAKGRNDHGGEGGGDKWGKHDVPVMTVHSILH